VAAALLAALALVPAWRARAELDAQVSAVQGDVRVGPEPLEQHQALEEGKRIVAGADGSCSVVLARKALVQFCGQTSVALREGDGERVAVVDVLGGTSRTTTERRAVDDPLEIHTPVGIAIMRGTIVATLVDPVTGETTFAVEEGVIEVRSVDPALGPVVTVRAGEQVTIRAREAPGVVVPIQPGNLADLARCTAGIRAAAVRAEAADLTIEIVEDDFPGPDVATEGPYLPPPLPSQPPGVCQEPSGGCPGGGSEAPRPAIPPPCVGKEGEHCTF
jgi:hypothetical protein